MTGMSFTPRGLVVPMVTPVTDEGSLDAAAIRRVIDWLIAGGVDGIFVLGTTGEGASVPGALRRRLVALSVEHSAGRCHLYAGIGGNSLADSRQAALDYLALGADAIVAHLPAYFALTSAEMVTYYQRLADALDGPLLIYNMPPTTHMSIPIEALQALSGHPRIVGVKDSENDSHRLQQALARFRDRQDFAVLIGAAARATEALRAGADGVVPSSGNLVPHRWRQLCESARAGHWADAAALQARLDDVARVYQNGRSLGQAVAALKAGMAASGLCGPAALPPLTTLDGLEQERLGKELAALDLA